MNRRIHENVEKEQDVIAQLAALLVNGATISVGQRFPVGWDTDGGRLMEVATERLLRKAARLAHVWEREHERLRGREINRSSMKAWDHGD